MFATINLKYFKSGHTMVAMLYFSMALKPCRECKRKVSTEASTCPRCGVPNPTIRSKKGDKRVNIEHGVEYCSECGIELPSGPPCTNPVGCRLAKISPWKKKKIDTDNIRSERVNNKKLAIDKYYAEKTKEAAEKKIIDKYFDGRSADNNPSSKGDGFWNGTEGLGKTFWLYFIVANIIGNFMLAGAATESLGLVYFVLAVIVGWNIFAVMGVFNSADNYKIDKIKSNQSYGYATAAKVVCVILVLSGLGNVITFLKAVM